MNKGNLAAKFKRVGDEIVVDLQFGRKKKGHTWNPLNIIGIGGKRLTVERKVLNNRVKELEQQLCNINYKIKKCEGTTANNDIVTTDEEELPDLEESMYSAPSVNEEQFISEEIIERERAKADERKDQDEENYMALFKKCKRKKMKKELKKQSAKYDPIETLSDKRKHPMGQCVSNKRVKTQKPYRLLKSVDRNQSSYWANEKTLMKRKDLDKKKKKKLYPCDSRSVNFMLKPSLSQKAVQTIVLSEEAGRTNSNTPTENSQRNYIHKGNNIFSNDNMTKSNLKNIIDEAVVDSIGRTLKKYFKEDLEVYIKKRVNSAIHRFNDDILSCYKGHIHTKSASEVTEEIFRDEANTFSKNSTTDSKTSQEGSRPSTTESTTSKSKQMYIKRRINKNSG